MKAIYKPAAKAPPPTVCEACGQEFTPAPLTEELPGDICRVYIECSNCKKAYTAYYTNPAIRLLQTRQHELSKKLETYRGKMQHPGRRNGKTALSRLYDKAWQEFAANKEKIEAAMNDLRQEVEAHHEV